MMTEYLAIVLFGCCLLIWLLFLPNKATNVMILQKCTLSSFKEWNPPLGVLYQGWILGNYSW